MSVLVRSITPSELYVECTTDDSLRKWRESLAREIEGSKYSKKHRDHPSNRRLPKEKREALWDGKSRPGDYLREKGLGHIWRGGRGLLATLQNYYGDRLQGTIEYPPRLNLQYPSSLRDFQKHALSLIDTYHWGRISFATNAGKGAVISLAAKAAADKGFRVLILCNSVAVFDALEGELREWGKMSVGRISAGVTDPPESRVVISMSQTLVRRIRPEWADKTKKKRLPADETHKRWRDWLGGMQMALLDEADFATSDEWEYILRHMPNNLWRIGFSGTFPATSSLAHVQLEERLGPVLAEIKNAELVDRGISAKPFVYLVPFQHPHYSVPSNLKGAERKKHVYEKGIVYNQRRHLLVKKLLVPTVPNVVIVHRVDHGAQLAEILPDSRFVSGETPGRMEILAAFERGEFQNLIVTSILDRGSNRLGRAGALIFASNEGSSRQILQRIGRGLRKGQNDKKHVLLFDITDQGNPYFQKAVGGRVALYRSEGFAINIAKVDVD